MYVCVCACVCICIYADTHTYTNLKGIRSTVEVTRAYLSLKHWNFIIGCDHLSWLISLFTQLSLPCFPALDNWSSVPHYTCFLSYLLLSVEEPHPFPLSKPALPLISSTMPFQPVSRRTCPGSGCHNRGHRLCHAYTCPPTKYM